MVEIQPAHKDHFEKIWSIIHDILKRGDTYPFAPETTQAEAFEFWMQYPTAAYVAFHEGELVGTYYIKPNQPGLGSHVCNAGYMVASRARGKGIGKAMCSHSLDEARKLGFKAMQYNLVVCTNKGAIKLWQDLGFKIIGTIPKAFNHSQEGLVDAFVMYQWLEAVEKD
jgi:L-amino acid N-acyltransferase YncA